jgi:hypothetical protein
VCKYGTNPANLDKTASGTSSSYYLTYDHHVILKNLAPSTTYYYQCGDSAAGWSDVISFKSAPSYDTLTYPIKILTFGDMGIWNSADSIVAVNDMASKGEFDFIWHLGDISYADDDFLHTPLEDNYENTWNTYMNKLQPAFSQFPYMVMPGNHEAECHSPSCETSLYKLSKLTNFTAYNGRFRMPSQESGGNSNMWYSFNYGPVHFTNIDTETNYPGSINDHYTLYGNNGDFWGDQQAWMTADLAKANTERDIRPWVFVGGHRPIYSVLHTDGNGMPSGYPTDEVVAAFEDIVYNGKVDGYWSGHEHSYERHWPVYKGTNVDKTYTDAQYPFYVVHGAAGCDEGHSTYKDVPFCDWNVMWDNQHYSLGLLTIESESKMSWKVFDSLTREVIDQITFQKTL